eukprot:g36023.t1
MPQSLRKDLASEGKNTPNSLVKGYVKNVPDEIYTITITLEMKFPKALFIVAGNFNQGQPQEYHQHHLLPLAALIPGTLDNKDTYISLLLIDYSSTFNTIIPSRLISK